MDKQIIIKKIRDCDNCKFRPETSKVCSDYENCYMVSEYIVNLREQLRAKEQECERLKDYFEIKKIITLENGDLVFESGVIQKLVDENIRYAQNLELTIIERENLKEARKNSRCAWKSLEGTFCPEAQAQLDQLKAENEELKHQIEDVDILVNEKESLIDKCLQTLTEIKEIAEDKSYIGFWDEQISEILQKISEVEDGI